MPDSKLATTDDLRAHALRQIARERQGLAGGQDGAEREEMAATIARQARHIAAQRAVMIQTRPLLDTLEVLARACAETSTCHSYTLTLAEAIGQARVGRAMVDAVLAGREY